LTYFHIGAYISIVLDKAKPFARGGRKATGFKKTETAELPKDMTIRVHGHFSLVKMVMVCYSLGWAVAINKRQLLFTKKGGWHG
jgi:hypothetical protein